MKTARQVGLALAVALASGSLALAKPEKQEKPASALKRAQNELRKLKGYRVDFQVQGGTAKGPEHAFQDMRVNQTWSAQVLGKVDNLNGGVAFRLRPGAEDGAIQEGGRWKAMLATEQGRLIARLFKGPELQLAEALKHSRRAEWLDPAPEAGKAGQAPDAESESDAESDAGSGPKETKTRSGDDTGPGSKVADGPLSHVIRIEGPAQEAVTNFNRIVSSGCFSEG